MTPDVEQWKPVVEYEGLYEVSDLGRVRSVERLAIDSIGRQRRYPGALRKVTFDPTRGRRMVSLKTGGQARSLSVSVLALRAFVGERPDGLYACHNNGDPEDDRLTNLRWDTPQENNNDAVRHGTNWQTAKAECPRGHRLAAPNLRHFTSRPDRRECLACHRTRANQTDARKHGRPFDFATVADAHYAQIMRTT